ncbi:MAG: hypothetical protein Q4B22_06810 [Eubacteriales bacterium]|nr:hypothetical protein [Eubacteriales bacterium]
MSRVLKIIDGIILAAFIVIGLALMLPKAFGIAVTVSDRNQVGNVPEGTTIYSRQIAGVNLVQNDQIVVQSGDKLNVYTIEAVDAEAGNMDVTGDLPGEHTTYKVPIAAQKIIRTVPLIGYLLLMVKTTRGLIMLAALLAMVIILFIVSEIIQGDDEEEEEEDDLPGYGGEDEDDDFYKKLAEQKTKRDNHRRVSEELPKPEMKNETEESAGKTEDEAWGDREDGLTELFQELAGEDKTEEEEVPEEPAAVDDMGMDVLPNVQAALEAALESQPLNRREENPMPVQEAPVEEEVVPNENGEIELAMPVYTADELLQKAYAEGLDPTVTEDETAGVTLVDYTECL